MNRETRLVVKDNALIDASFNMSLVEHRLMSLALVEAREISNLSPETPIEIKAKDYLEQYNLDERNAYKQISEASKQLFNRQFTYHDKYKGGDCLTTARWVNRATYVNDKGTVVIYLSSEVISLITRLYEHFTKYYLKQISDLKSKYSARLYELLAKWFNQGYTQKYEINEFRRLMGVEDNEYKAMSDFKIRVLEASIKEINLKTDKKVSYEQFKSGRIITHIMFTVKDNLKNKTKDPSRDVNTIDMFNGLTDKQADMFADKLARDTKFQQHFIANVGEELPAYAKRIRAKLTDSFYVMEWIEYLESVGYKSGR